MSLLYRKTSKELLWAKMFFGDNQSCFEKEKKNVYFLLYFCHRETLMNRSSVHFFQKLYLPKFEQIKKFP